MAEIRPGNNLFYTTLDIFTILPNRQEVLLDLMRHFISSVMKHKEGFVASNTLKSVDDTYIANYTQWRSVADYINARYSVEFKEYANIYASLVEKTDTNIYKVAFTSGQKTIIGIPSDDTILINLFSVTPKQEQSLLTLLIDFIYPKMYEEVGYLSTNLHRSLDGAKIFNYSCWTQQEASLSVEKIVDMIINRASENEQNSLRSSIQKVDSHLYKIVFTSND